MGEWGGGGEERERNKWTGFPSRKRGHNTLKSDDVLEIEMECYLPAAKRLISASKRGAYSI